MVMVIVMLMNMVIDYNGNSCNGNGNGCNGNRL